MGGALSGGFGAGGGRDFVQSVFLLGGSGPALKVDP
jgi:hypothetical protein